MGRSRWRWIVLLGAGGAFCAGTALAGVTAASHAAPAYEAGQDLTVTGTIEHSGSVTALGLQVTLPAGWSLVSTGGADEPQVAPPPGRTGTLEFAWFTIPASPVRFTYTLAVPAGETGAREISGTVLSRTTGAEEQTAVSPAPLVTQPASAPPSGGGNGGGGGGCFIRTLSSPPQ